jgi:integrase
VEDGHVSANPVTRILRRKRDEKEEQRKHVTFLTREETAILLKTCQEHFPSYYPLILLLVRTGMRIGEALALQWGDLDFHSRFAEVKRTFSNGRLSTPKSGKSRRVDLSQQLTETLKALQVERKKATLKRGWGEVPPWVFLNRDPVPLQRSHFAGRVWPKLLMKAGVRYVRIHDLRHTYASLLIQQGESLAYVKEQLWDTTAFRLLSIPTGTWSQGGTRRRWIGWTSSNRQPSAIYRQPFQKTPFYVAV